MSVTTHHAPAASAVAAAAAGRRVARLWTWPWPVHLGCEMMNAKVHLTIHSSLARNMETPLLGGAATAAGTGSALDTGVVFAYVVGGAQLAVLVGFGLLASADYSSDSYAVTEPQLYDYYVGVALMMLVGFGYLMTFLRW